MEKPAVIFSEQGFRIFLDFIKGTQEKDNPVDALVKDYFARPDKPDLSGKVEEVQTNTKHDMDAVAKLVFDTLYHSNYSTFTSEDIHSVLLANGYEYELRGITPVMRGIMNRYPDIERVDTGTYKYVGPIVEEGEE